MELSEKTKMKITAYRQALRAAVAVKNWPEVDKLQRILGQVGAAAVGDHLIARMSDRAQSLNAKELEKKIVCDEFMSKLQKGTPFTVKDGKFVEFNPDD